MGIKKLYFLFGIKFVCLFLFFTVFVISILLFFKSNGRSVKEVSPQSYNHFVFDPKLNKTSFAGFTTLPKGFEKDFIAYENRDGRLNLLSAFGDTVYECTGSCFCQEGEEDERRVAQTVLVRGLVTLLAAVSSVVALNLAREEFHEGCARKYSGECSPNSILSEVEECDELEFEKNWDLEGEQRVTHYVEKGYPELRESREFLCEGNCMYPTIGQLQRSERALDISKSEGNCHNRKLITTVTISSDEPGYIGDKGRGRVYVRSKFFGHLQAYCKKISPRKITVFIKNKAVDSKMTKVKLFHLCVGQLNKINPSVKCTQTKVYDNKKYITSTTEERMMNLLEKLKEKEMEKKRDNFGTRY